MGYGGWYSYLNAKDDWAKTGEDSSVAIDVLANDVGASGIVKVNGKPVTADTPPLVLASGATVDLDGTTLLYDPGSAFQTLNTGQSASDKFSYTVSGSGKSTDTAYVKVTITGEDEEQPVSNLPPVAADDEAVLPQLLIDLSRPTNPRSVEIDVLANDTDPNGGPLKVATIAGIKVDTDPTTTDVPDTVTLNKGTATVTLNADGSLTYTEIPLDLDLVIQIDGHELDDGGGLVLDDGGGFEWFEPDPISPYYPDDSDLWPVDSFTYTVTNDKGAESNAATVTVSQPLDVMIIHSGVPGEGADYNLDSADPWLM
jgi:Bacterial cadherin-like domain